MGYNEDWILKTEALAGLGVLLAIGAIILIGVLLVFIVVKFGGWG